MERPDLAPDVFAECGEEIFQGLQSEPVFRYILDCFKNDEDWIFHEPPGQGPAGPAVRSCPGPCSRRRRRASVEEAQECLRSLRKVHCRTG